MAKTLLLSWSSLFREKPGKFNNMHSNLRSLNLLQCSIVVPDEGYLAKCHELCKKYNVLLICDEIQTVRIPVLLLSEIQYLFVLFQSEGPLPHGQDALLRVGQCTPGCRTARESVVRRRSAYFPLV